MKLRTTPYHPETGVQFERFKSTLISKIGNLEVKGKSHWKDFVPTLMHASTCTKSNATDVSPYFLMFGIKPRLPLDQQYGLQTDKLCARSHHKYVAQLEEQLQWTHYLAW